MSSMLTRRRRHPRRRRLHDRNPSVEVIEGEGSERAATSTCIDLTNEDDDIVVMNSTPRSVVDLTSVIDSPIVLLGTPDSPPRRKRRAQVPSSLAESDSDEDLLELPPFEIPDVPRPSTATAIPPADSTHITSPDRTVSCPVCLDNTKEIQKSKRQIFSTICGHIFCDQCITDAIKAQKKCPTCRKKLTLKQIHPIFI